MSRIFDALRRSENEKAVVPTTPSGEQTRLRDLLQQMEARPAGFDQVPRIVCRTPVEEPIVTGHDDHGLGGEKFRALCHRLRQVRQSRVLSKLLITSAVPKEGKTFIALNLAVTWATSPARVVLVDTDMRQSGLSRALGLPLLPGLADYLEERIPLEQAFRLVEPFGLYYVPAGSPTANPVNLLQKPLLAEFLTQAAAAFDWVVVDSPPLMPVADAQCLAGLCDGTLLVVRPGCTPRDGLEQALRALQGSFTVGIVLNGSGDAYRDHYYYYYAPSNGRNGRRRGSAPAPQPPQEPGA